MRSILLQKHPYDDDDDGSEADGPVKPKFVFKPCIAELIRTEYCAPSMVLLVTQIEIECAKPPHENRGAYRLYLSDGEYMMQGWSIVMGNPVPP